MRVAAGVLLIIAAVINLFAGLSYLAGGGVLVAGNKFAAMAEKAEKQQGRDLTEEQKQQFAQIDDASKNPKVGAAARGIMAYGGFLVLTVGTSIACAVCLFRRRAPKFIAVTASLALLAEVGGCVAAAVLVGPGVLVVKFLISACGIFGGAFGLLGARQIMLADAQPVDVPASLASPM